MDHRTEIPRFTSYEILHVPLVTCRCQWQWQHSHAIMRECIHLQYKIDLLYKTDEQNNSFFSWLNIVVSNKLVT